VINSVARAKVNLALGVVGRRPDGYHDLVSVFARLDLADRLSAEPSGDGDRLLVAGGSVDYRPGAGDLALRALRLLRETRLPGAPGLALGLEKHVPLAAGLAGGSADAAAALALAARTWGIELADAERLALAVQLGSDVPFLAADVDAALVTGRGEQVRPLPGPLEPVGILLVTTGGGLSTREVFAVWAADDMPGTAGALAAEHARDLSARLESGCRAEGLVVAAAELRDANDLWPAVIRLRPDLVPLRDTLEARLARPVLLSGSGPTLIALYPSRAAAETATTALRAEAVAGLPAAAIRTASFGRTTTREGR
jgi:4-diphosphocytidyl-2-C-methyl-D-erythritol kinase